MNCKQCGRKLPNLDFDVLESESYGDQYYTATYNIICPSCGRTHIVTQTYKLESTEIE